MKHGMFSICDAAPEWSVGSLHWFHASREGFGFQGLARHTNGCQKNDQGMVFKSFPQNFHHVGIMFVKKSCLGFKKSALFNFMDYFHQIHQIHFQNGNDPVTPGNAYLYIYMIYTYYKLHFLKQCMYIFMYLFIYLFIYLCIYLFMYLFIYL